MKKFCNTLFKTAVTTAAIAAATLTPMTAAKADHIRHHRAYERHVDRGDAVLLGVLGLAAGAIIGGTIADSRANQAPRIYEVEPSYPQRGYYPPAPAEAYPYRAAPAETYPVYVDGGLDPWTPGWYRYCSQRYRSFDPDTGTYRGYDGRDHFCIAD